MHFCDLHRHLSSMDISWEKCKLHNTGKFEKDYVCNEHKSWFMNMEVSFYDFKGHCLQNVCTHKVFFENGMKTKHIKLNFDQMSIQKKICFTCLKLYTEKYHSTNVW